MFQEQNPTMENQHHRLCPHTDSDEDDGDAISILKNSLGAFYCAPNSEFSGKKHIQ